MASLTFSAYPPDKNDIFLVALAAGNWVSELAALQRTGLETISRVRPVFFPASPGLFYSFKNQRLGSSSLDVVFVPLTRGPQELVPANRFGLLP